MQTREVARKEKALAAKPNILQFDPCDPPDRRRGQAHAFLSQICENILQVIGFGGLETRSLYIVLAALELRM